MKRRSPARIPQASAHTRALPPTHRHRRGWMIAGLIVVLVLVAVRFVGSPIAGAMVNRKLAEMPDYIGRVEGVTIAIWRGALDVRDFVLYERGFEDQPPLLHVRKAAVVFAPGPLLRGHVAGRIRVEGLEVNAVKRIDEDTGAAGRTPEERERELEAQAREAKEAVKRWQDELRHAFPLELTRFELTDGRVNFVDVTKQPKAEIHLENLRVVARDLQNRPEPNGDPMPATLEVTGLIGGSGRLRLTAQVDPLAEQPRFTGSLEVRELSLPALDSFLRGYAKAEVSRGTFELFSEVEAQDGGYEGYIKPLFRDLEFRPVRDEDDNVLERLTQQAVNAVTSLLENEDQEQVATKAPFSGNFADNEVDIWTTIATLFRNAFVEALRGGFEGGS